MQIVIFSFNRAIQLDALLDSLLKHWKNPKSYVDVLYNTSDEAYQKGYELLKERYRSKFISFHKENPLRGSAYPWPLLAKYINFKAFVHNKYIRKPKTNFRSLLFSIIESNPKRELMFMTDDSLFIRDVDVSEEVFSWLHAAPRNRQLSLRLGRGMNGESQFNIQEEEGWLTWNMSKVPGKNNWSYTFSVDAHIYDKSTLFAILKKTIFCNPSSLEGYMHLRSVKDGLFQEAKAPLKPTLLSFPINMVQKVAENETMGVSTEMLNDYYLNGYRLEYPIPSHYSTFQIYPDHISLVNGINRLDINTK